MPVSLGQARLVAIREGAPTYWAPSAVGVRAWPRFYVRALELAWYTSAGAWLPRLTTLSTHRKVALFWQAVASQD